MKKKWRIRLFVFIVLAITGFIWGYLEWNTPHINIKDSDAIKISSIRLYKVFTEDSAKARSTYVNTILLVNGKVKQVLVNQQSQQVILLNTNVTGSSVNCTLEQNAKGIQAGDSILIKGVCSGYLAGDKEMDLPGDVFMIRCYCLQSK